MPFITCRRILAGALIVVLCAMATSCGAPGAGSGTRSPHRGSGAQPVAPAVADHRIRTGESVLQIVAHPDDDLYFMNPDVSQSLASGRPLATVYLTAGQANGVNAPRGATQSTPRADRAAYAKARQNGIRAAYAWMTTGDRTSPWRRQVIPTAAGGQAELDTLIAHPRLRLVWLQLHEAESVGKYRPRSLRTLWNGRTPALKSLIVTGGAVTRATAYTREQLILTLTGLLERFRPTFVRMQDPTPDRKPDGDDWTDHQDHTYGARFVQQALARYAASGGSHPRAGTQVYLGYLNRSLPLSLGPAALSAKLKALDIYAWNDGYDCHDPAGCGDRKVGNLPRTFSDAQSTRYHRGESTTWLAAQENGALRAFGVLDGRLAVWSQRARDSARWSGPVLLSRSGIDDGVTAVTLHDGRIAVFATRTVLDEGSGNYRREVVTTVQTTPGGKFGPWQSLGAPAGDAETSLQIGAPAAAVDGRGLLTAFLRNGVHRLGSRTREPDGTWGPWADRGGEGLLGNLAVATDREGRTHVFASTPTSVLAWSQPRPGAPLGAPVATGLPATTGPLSAQADGSRVRLYFRQPRTAAVVTARSPERGQPWGAHPAGLGGNAGFGPVGTTGDGSQTLLAARDGTGAPSTAVYTADSGTLPTWTSAGFLCAGAPAGVSSSPHGPALAVIGLDSRLYWKQGRGYWTAVGENLGDTTTAMPQSTSYARSSSVRR